MKQRVGVVVIGMMPAVRIVGLLLLVLSVSVLLLLMCCAMLIHIALEYIRLVLIWHQNQMGAVVLASEYCHLSVSLPFVVL